MRSSIATLWSTMGIRTKALTDVVGRFRGEASGMAAVEFAFILPVMLLFYLGTYEVTQMVKVNGRVARVADTVGNLVTRLKTVDDTSLKNVFGISSAIMNPNGISPLTMTVTAVRVDVNGKATVHWSKASKGPTAAIGSPFVIPTELAALKDTYFVVSKATYDYQTPFGYDGIVGDMTFSHSSEFRPRKSLEVTWK
jgi:Flp pilus assembly protein TadG